MIFDFLRKFRKFNKSDKFYEYRKTISSLEGIVKFRIDNPEYYLKALTHRSYLDVDKNLKKSNERLEYLGDAVLDLVVGEYLFENFPDGGEGFLTKTRSQLVDKEALASTAENIGLEELIFYKRNFIGRNKEGLRTILADAFEALIGAIYMDKGLGTARTFISKNLIEPFDKTGKMVEDKNYKGQLLELTHSLKIEQPVYKIADAEGPEHNKTFIAKVFIGEEEYGEGNGKSKKSAEQKAALSALNKLKEKS